SHERAELLVRAEAVRLRLDHKEAKSRSRLSERAIFPETRKVVDAQNEGLLEPWHELPRKVQDQVWVHLRHYLHSVLGVSWLFGATPGVSALLSISWRKQPVSLTLKQPIGSLPPDPASSETVARLLDRLGAAIAELGYAAVVADLS